MLSALLEKFEDIFVPLPPEEVEKRYGVIRVNFKDENDKVVLVVSVKAPGWFDAMTRTFNRFGLNFLTRARYERGRLFTYFDRSDDVKDVAGNPMVGGYEVEIVDED